MIVTENIENSNNWEILACGSSGKNGQAGGDGEKGKNGEKFSVEETKQYGVKWYSKASFKKSFGENFLSENDSGFFSANYYNKFKNSKGSILWSFARRIFVDDELLLIQGAEAELGKRGGIGGISGQGGHCGEILIINLNRQPLKTNVNTVAYDGEIGKDGENGKYGSQGERGKFLNTIICDCP